MRKRMICLAVMLMLLIGTAAAEGVITASVHVKASRNVYDSMIRVGEDVDMTVEIDGFTPSACQWYLGDQPIEGGNLSTLHIDSAEVSDTGVYRMDALDENGRVLVSADVALRVVDYSIPKTGDERVSKPHIVGLMALAAVGAALAIRKKAAGNA